MRGCSDHLLQRDLHLPAPQLPPIEPLCQLRHLHADVGFCVILTQTQGSS